MKKNTLFAALLGLASLQANAQSYELYDFSNDLWEDFDGEMYTPVGVMYKVSANGKYAVGYDGIIYAGAVYYWTADDPEGLLFINQGNNRISLSDVANDGTMVGSFEQRKSDDSETKEICYPGYYVVGEGWTQLPVPEKYSQYYGKESDFLNEARAITPDGKYIVGNLYVTQGYKQTIFGITESAYLLPCLWTKNDEGKYELTNVYRDIWKNSLQYKDGELVAAKDSVNFQSFYVWDISNDGSTIVGVNTAGSGGQNPAIIRNGQMIQLFNCGEEDDADELKNFNGGICNSIDANGNVYGYYQFGDQSVKYFVFTADNQLVFLNKLISCADKNGKQYSQSFDKLPYVLDCSEDGSVIAGGVGLTTDFGMMNAPALLWDESITNGISRSQAADETVSLDYQQCGNLFVNGLYNEVAIYNAGGKLIAKGGQGKAFNLSNQPSGVYMIQVKTGQGAKTFKVTR